MCSVRLSSPPLNSLNISNIYSFHWSQTVLRIVTCFVSTPCDAYIREAPFRTIRQKKILLTKIVKFDRRSLIANRNDGYLIAFAISQSMIKLICRRPWAPLRSIFRSCIKNIIGTENLFIEISGKYSPWNMRPLLFTSFVRTYTRSPNRVAKTKMWKKSVRKSASWNIWRA